MDRIISPEALMLVWPIVILAMILGLMSFISQTIRDSSKGTVVSGLIGIGMVATIISSVRLFQMPLGSDLLVTTGHLYDRLGLVMTIVLCGFFSGVLAISVRSGRQQSAEWTKSANWLMAGLLGAVLMVWTQNLLVLLVGFLLIAASSICLTGRGVQASRRIGMVIIPAVIFSAAMATGVLLLGGMTESYNLHTVMLRLFIDQIGSAGWLGLGFLLAGIGFIVAVLPWYGRWTDGDDASVWLMSGATAGGLIAGVRTLQIIAFYAPPFVPQIENLLTYLVGGSAVVVMTAGNLMAYRQSDLRRIVGYALIAHVGYLLCAMAVIGETDGVRVLVAGIPMVMITGLGALSSIKTMKKSRLSTGLAMVFLLSLAGIPPLASFAFRWMLIDLLWQNQLFFLMAAVAANSVLGFVYILRAMRMIPTITGSDDRIGLPTVCAAALIGLSVGFFAWREFIGEVVFTVFPW